MKAFFSYLCTLKITRITYTRIKMIIYNTTYTVSNADAKNFIIWAHEVYIPKAKEGGILTNPRLCQILTHKDEETECFSLQFEVESTALLNQWYAKNGKTLVDELVNTFGQSIVGFATIMNDITLRA